jgi:hypothetical protein
MTVRGRLVAAAYVATVAVLAARSFWSRDQTFSVTEAIAFALTLPVLVVAIPAVYLLGAAVWSLTDAGDGGPMWPVTVAFTLMLAGIAVANVWVVRRLLGRRRAPVRVR